LSKKQEVIMALGKNRVRLNGISVDIGLSERMRVAYDKNSEGARTYSKYVEKLLYRAVREVEALSRIDEVEEEDYSGWD
jgi:hypothetical protein